LNYEPDCKWCRLRDCPIHAPVKPGDSPQPPPLNDPLKPGKAQ